MTADIVVIGAGHNGLTAASVLAKAGKRVLVLEQASEVGGAAAARSFHEDYRLPGLLHETNAVRTKVIEELSLHSHGLSLRPNEPPVFAPRSQGRGIVVAPYSVAASDGDGLSDADRRGLEGFFRFANRVGSALRPLLNAAPPEILSTGVGDLLSLAKTGYSLRKLGRDDLMEFLRAGPMCVADCLNERFDDSLLKACLAAPAIRGLFCGPWSPGTALTLFYHAAGREHRGVLGGGAALVKALSSALKSLGGEVRVGAKVAHITVVRGEAVGVVLSSGERIGATTVLSCCDPKQTFLNLIAPVDLPLKVADEIRVLRSRGCCAKLHLALTAPLEFEHHPGEVFERIRIGEDLDTLERAFDSAKYGEFSERPNLDLWVPTVSDPTLAPPGHHVVSILVQYAPHRLKEGWTDKSRKALEKAVLDRVCEVAPKTREKIKGSELLTPADLEEQLCLTEGHIDHGEHALDQLLFMRPSWSCHRYATPLAGLFVGGSGSHPGGGLTCAPGYLAANAILR